MRTLFRFISLPYMQQHRLRLLFPLLGIALGVAVFVAVRVTNSSTLRAFGRTVDAIAGRASLEITGHGAPLDETLLRHVRRTPGVDTVAPLVLADVLVQEAEGEALLIAGVDIVADRGVRDYTFRWTEGDQQDPFAMLTQPGAVVVNERFATRHGFEIGTPFHIHTAQGTQQLVVRGFLRPEGVAEALGGHFAIMDIAAAQVLFNRVGRLDRLDVVPKPGFPLATVQATLQQRLGPSVRVRRPQARNESIEKMLRSFHVNLTALSLIALIVGMFLIYNSTTMAVVQRRRELGILRALGVTRRRLFRLIMGEVLGLGILGVGLGLGLGLLLARFALQLVSPAVSALYIVEHISRLTLTWDTVAGGVALGLSTTVLSAAWPTRAALRISPLGAIQQHGVYAPRQTSIRGVTLLGVVLVATSYGLAQLPAVGGVAVFGYVACLTLVLGISCVVPGVLRGITRVGRHTLTRWFGVEGLLALDNLLFALRRTTVATAALLTSFAMMISVVIMIESFKRTVYTWVEQTLTADLLVHQATPGGERSSLTMPHQLRPEILQLEGVRDVDSARAIDVEFRGDTLLLVAVDFDVYAQYGSYPLVEGDRREAMRQVVEEEGVLVSENLHWRYGLGAGEQLHLDTPTGRRAFRVAGVVIDYSSDRGTITMNRRTYVRYWGDDHVDAFGVFVTPGADLDRIAQRITRHFAPRYPLYVLTRAKFRERVLELVEQPFAVTYALEIIAIIVALLGVTNALYASILERTRELGVLRAVGATQWRVRRMVLIEGGIMGVIGGGCGLVAGLLLSRILIFVINLQAFGWTLQVTVPLGFVLVTLVLFVVATVLASYRPAQQAAQVQLTEAVQYE